MVKTHIFRHKRYRILFLPKLSSAGRCDPPEEKNRSIKILNGQSPKEEVETVLHEAIHACIWDIHEPLTNSASLQIVNEIFKIYTITRGVKVKYRKRTIEEESIITLIFKNLKNQFLDIEDDALSEIATDTARLFFRLYTFRRKSHD